MARIWGRAKSQSPAGTPGTPRCHRCHRCHPRHPRHAAQRESHVCHVCHVAVWWALLSDNNWQQLHQVQRQLVGFLGFRGFLGFLGFPVTLLILFEEQKQYFHQNYLDTSCYEVDLQLVMNSTRCVTRCIHMCQIGCSVVDGAVLLFKVSNGYLELWKRFARHFEMVHRCM